MSFWRQDGITNLGAQVGDIGFVEKRIGITFPSEYVTLMQEHNGGYVEEDMFVYTNKDNMTETGSICMFNLFDLLKEYIDPPPHLPKGLIPFAIDGGGALTCFDYRNCKENPPIVFWIGDVYEEESLHFVANDFDEFISMLYKEGTMPGKSGVASENV